MNAGEIHEVTPGELAGLTFWPVALMAYGTPSPVVSTIASTFLMVVVTRGADVWLARPLAWIGTPRDRARLRRRRTD